MRVIGSFDQLGGPWVQGSLFFPLSGLSGMINFLVDTGSDVTTLNPSDGKRLDIDYSSLKFDSEFYGTNSRSLAAELEACVSFISEDGYGVRYNLTVSIPPYNKELEILPSLLGRDVLKRWGISWNFKTRQLIFDVLSQDAIESF